MFPSEQLRSSGVTGQPRAVEIPLDHPPANGPRQLVVYGRANRQVAEPLDLAITLINSLSVMDETWSSHPVHKLSLTKTKWGQPVLTSLHGLAPAISFSHGWGDLWGAVTTTGSIGCDVTADAEFFQPYPYDRAFRAGELTLVRELFNTLPAAASFLWAVKEAAVKARGTAFNQGDFLDLEVTTIQAFHEGWWCEIAIDHPGGRWHMAAWASRLDQAWLALSIGP